jgi:hypothetical protein
MARLPLGRRLSTAARWPLGVGLTSWSYMWRTTPMSRQECEGGPEDARPPALPPDFDTREVQTTADGVGDVFHRVYRVRIAGAQRSAAELIEDMRRDPNTFAPSEFASFQTVGEDRGPCRPGHEYVVRMPGPWDGPVRVAEVSESSIRLATLRGHLEAGQIEFRAAQEDGELEFTIESWARSASRLTDLLYAHLRMSKEIQLHMWVSFLERVVGRSGGRRSGRVAITTHRVDAPRDG